MIRIIVTLTISVAILFGCTSVNRSPDILLQEPLNRVRYIAEPEKYHKTIDIVQVNTRGVHAGILTTIPELYKRALDKSNNDFVEIGNISITSYTNKEEVQVPHEKCKSVTEEVYVPQKSCIIMSCPTTCNNNGVCMTQICPESKCTTIDMPKIRSREECTTQYKTEVRTVLYQKATADILTLKERD